jgi:flagellar capping protein FliD|tara:strand:- start:796 stop:1380 length:585 start_codon:yes stop_codon:yes gene_type:complete
MSTIYKYALYTVVFFLTATGFSQVKKEYEKRISEADFPAEALSLISPFKKEFNRLKYYKEFDGDNQSFEAKFKYESSHYSVEFNNEGKLEDVELKLSKNKLPKALWEAIKLNLDSNYERWKLEKLQCQYSHINNPKETLEKALNKTQTKQENYELIVAIKQKGKLKKMEILFNARGEVLNRRDILRRSYDFLIF